MNIKECIDETKNKKWYIVYMQRFSILGSENTDYQHLYVYKVYTNDIFHVIGVMHYTTLERIERITFREAKENENIDKIELYNCKY